jgi:transcriptional regulator with XRE-family HTH domain
MDAKKIGVLLKTCRLSAGFTQSAIAGHLHIDRALVSKIEHGEHMPRIDQVLTWAQVTESQEFISIMIMGHEELHKVTQMKVALNQIRNVMSQLA